MKKNQKNRTEKKETILVVDDEKIVLLDLKRGLQELGYSAIPALSAEEAWELFKKKEPDVVLADIGLPGANGLDLLAWIKKESPSTPVIMVTAYADDMTLQEAAEKGADGYLIKPFEDRELKAQIEVSSRKSKYQKELQYYKNLSDSLNHVNKTLKEKLKRFYETKNGGLAEKEIERLKAICGSIAHSLKGEFLNIGYSLKEIRESSNKSPDILEESDVIERCIAHSQLLMGRLLNFLDMGTPRKEPLELWELMRKTEELARPRLPSNVQLIIKIPPYLKKQKISANLEQLMGVLLEFINNASRVLQQKGGTGGTIEIELGGKSKKVLISIKDDGPGIPAKLRDKLLTDQVPSKSGLGLGLYLCNKVIAEFSGQIKLLNTGSKGTTFSIILPVIDNQKES
jgi:DNA-binding response OmpR family regulator